MTDFEKALECVRYYAENDYTLEISMDPETEMYVITTAGSQDFFGSWDGGVICWLAQTYDDEVEAGNIKPTYVPPKVEDFETLYGYNINHLALIATLLQKEDLPPDRLTEIVTDIGRIIDIIVQDQAGIIRDTVKELYDLMINGIE